LGATLNARETGITRGRLRIDGGDEDRNGHG